MSNLRRNQNGLLRDHGGSGGGSGSSNISIGLFTAAGSEAIPVGTDVVRTSGYATVGVGGAEYIYDPAVNPAYVAANPLSSFYDGARGFRLSEDQEPRPEMFGAGGRNLTIDDVGCNAFFAWCIGKQHIPTPILTGTYRLANPVAYVNPDTLNFGDDSTLCSTFDFKCTFIATAPMDHMLTFTRINNAVLMGRIRFTGGANNARAQHFAGNGLLLDYCGGAVVSAKITGSRMIYGVVEAAYAPSNNNLARIESVHGSRHGAMAFGDNIHTANFSARVDTGGASSSNQLATFTVDSLPPAFIDPPVRPVLVRINGYYHRLVSVDRGLSKVSITPWPSTAVTGGNFNYFYGACVNLRGNDANIIDIGTISSQGGGGGLAMMALYGGVIGSIHCELGGVALAIGNQSGSTALGLEVGRLYCEGADVHFAAQTSIPDCINIRSATPFDEDRIITSGWYSPGGAVTPIYAQLPPGYTINGKSPNPARNDIFASLIDLDAPHNQDQIWSSPTANVIFDILAPVNDVQSRLYNKPFRMSVEPSAGFGVAGVPTSVTFNAPATWTINGSASVVFEPFGGVPEFSITRVFATNQLTVRQLIGFREGVHFRPLLAVGEQISTQAFGGLAGSSLFAIDRLDAALIRPARDFSISEITFDVTTAVAASTAKIVIYDYVTNARLAVSPDISTAAVAVSAPWINNFTFKRGKDYLIGIHASAAITIRASDTRSAYPLGCDASGIAQTTMRQSVPYASGPPATLAGTKTTLVTPPLFVLKQA